MLEVLPQPLRLLVIFAVLSWVSTVLFLAAIAIDAVEAAAIFAFALGASLVGVFRLGGAKP
jgi:hypothetical protein